MQVDDTAIHDAKILAPRRIGDARGWFSETWNRDAMRAVGLDCDFMQDNHSRSNAIYTLRGLHYQAPPFAQTKLVRVVAGRVLDVVVDMRPSSPTYLASVAVELSAIGGEQILAPKGCLHGFLTLEENVEVVYKVDAPYAAEADGAVSFDDPELAIDWGVDHDLISLSDKDRAAPRLSEWTNPFAEGVS